MEWVLPSFLEVVLDPTFSRSLSYWHRVYRYIDIYIVDRRNITGWLVRKQAHCPVKSTYQSIPTRTRASCIYIICRYVRINRGVCFALESVRSFRVPNSLSWNMSFVLQWIGVTLPDAIAVRRRIPMIIIFAQINDFANFIYTYICTYISLYIYMYTETSVYAINGGYFDKRKISGT